MKKKIAILGHQSITKIIIDKLLSNNINVDTIIGLDKSNSHQVSDYFDFKKFSALKGIKFFNPDIYSLKSKKCISFFSRSNFDYLLVVGWSRLVPKEILSTVNISTVGWHGGPFKPPRCRGRAVVNWAIIDNKKKFYVYAMDLKPGVDDGDIYRIDHVIINTFDTSKTAYFKMGLKVATIYLDIIKNNLKPSPQPKRKATYLPKRTPEDSGLNWSTKVEDVYNFVRALADPYPNAFTIFNKNKVFIKSVIPFEEDPSTKYIPGKIYYIFHDFSLLVGCKDGLILVQKYRSDAKISFKVGDRFKTNSGKRLILNNY